MHAKNRKHLNYSVFSELVRGLIWAAMVFLAKLEGLPVYHAKYVHDTLLPCKKALQLMKCGYLIPDGFTWKLITLEEKVLNNSS